MPTPSTPQVIAPRARRGPNRLHRRPSRRGAELRGAGSATALRSAASRHAGEATTSPAAARRLPGVERARSPPVSPSPPVSRRIAVLPALAELRA
jgi:hypothetical protein